MKGRLRANPLADPVSRPTGVQSREDERMLTTRLNLSWSKGPATIRALLACSLLILLNPMLTHAQQTMNAQKLTPDAIALSAPELGPEWSVASDQEETLDDGTQLAELRYSAASGRQVLLTTGVAPSVDYAEAVLNYLRYQVERDGGVVSSVQSKGFGDGRAFKAEWHGTQHVEVAYMFRVRNLIALIGYVGPTSAGDVESEAQGAARKQEAKLFGFFAPPPDPTVVPTLEPTLAPTPVSTPAPSPTVTSNAAAVTSDSSPVQTAPYCQPGQKPQFALSFATLSAQLGTVMGNPVSCQYSDPGGSGDTLQATDTGLAVYRASSGITTFTNGSDHWALVAGHVVHWTGDSLDPPADPDQSAA
jgi:hypothetical protein